MGLSVGLLGSQPPKKNISNRVTQKSSPIVDLGRRALLAAAVSSTFVLPSYVKAQEPIESRVKEELPTNSYLTRLNLGFKKFLDTPESNLEFTIGSFISIVKDGDINTFFNWYEKEISTGSENEKKQIVLEILGRKLIADFRNLVPNTPLEVNAVHLGNLLPLYAKVIKNNNHKENFVKNGLTAADEPINYPGLRDIKEAEWNKFKKAGEGSKKVEEGILDLYEAAMEGVSKLETIPCEIKQKMFEVPWDGEPFGDVQDPEDVKKGIIKDERIKKGHDRYVDIVSKYYFGLKKNHGDVEGALSWIAYKTTASATNPNTGWSPYMVYKVIDRNRDYFKAIANLAVESVKESLLNRTENTGEPKTEKKQAISKEEIKKFLVFLSSLPRVKQGYYYPSFMSSVMKEGVQQHYPVVPDPIKKRVHEFIDKEIVEYVVSTYQNAYVEAFEKLKVDMHYSFNQEKIVQSGEWNSFNSQLKHDFKEMPYLTKLFSEDLVGKRLKKEDNSYSRDYNREMVYRTLGALYTHACVDSKLLGFNFLKEGVKTATSPQEAQGIGYALSILLRRNQSGKMTFDEFLGKIEEVNKITKKKKELSNKLSKAHSERKTQKEIDSISQELEELFYGSSEFKMLEKLDTQNLSEPQRLFLDLLRITQGYQEAIFKQFSDQDLIPKYIKTYVLPDGRNISLTLSMNDDEDSVAERHIGTYYDDEQKKQIPSKYKLVKEERIDSISEEDYLSLMRVVHNAFQIVAYATTEEAKDELVQNQHHFVFAVAAPPPPGSPGDPSFNEDRFKKAIKNILLPNLLFNLTDGPGAFVPEYWGEKLGALLEVVREDEIPNFKSIFFEHDPKNAGFGSPGIVSYLENIMKKSAGKDEKKLGEVHQEIQRLKIGLLAGFLRTAKSRKFADHRRLMANVIGEGKYMSVDLTNPYGHLVNIYKWKPNKFDHAVMDRSLWRK